MEFTAPGVYRFLEFMAPDLKEAAQSFEERVRHVKSNLPLNTFAVVARCSSSVCPFMTQIDVVPDRMHCKAAKTG